MKKIFLTALVGSCAFFATPAEALKVQVLPSVTFRSSQQTCYPCPTRVVTRPVTQVHHYYDPYTGQEYIYHCPGTTYHRVAYPCCQQYRTQGTDFQLQFRIW